MGPITRITAPTVEVLRIFLKTPSPLWGLHIAKEIKRAPGSVYPILSRLEIGGWIVASWDADNERSGPRRRLYQLTEDGRAEAQMLVSNYDRSAEPSTPLKFRLA